MTNLLIALDTASFGTFSGTITLQNTGSNTSTYSGALPDVVINLTGNVVEVPEPTSTGFAILVGCALLARRRCAELQDVNIVK